MRSSRTKQEAIDRGRVALSARLHAELKHQDVESSTDQFLDAEATVGRYLDTVAQRTMDLPTSEDLAFACAILLVGTKAVEERDLTLLGRLYMPEVGVDMVAIAPQVEQIKARAIAKLEELANQPEPPSDRPLIDDVLF